jgi:hypothetical protein
MYRMSNILSYYVFYPQLRLETCVFLTRKPSFKKSDGDLASP